MKKELIPYYVSRAVLSVAFTLAFIYLGGTTWVGILLGVVSFAGFIWYAHSGRFVVDTSSPLTPLRRDARGKVIRDRAAAAGISVGGTAFFLLFLARNLLGWNGNLDSLALPVGVITYFIVSNFLYAAHRDS